MMTEERKKTSGTGCAAWMTMASVALNLFLVGVLAGPFLGGHDTNPAPMDRPLQPPRSAGPMLDFVARDLAPEEAAKLRTIFEEGRKVMRDRHADMRATMQKLAVILKADKPDMAALRKVLDEAHDFGQVLHDNMSRSIERVATEMSVESRRKIAEAIEQHRFGMGPPPPDGRPSDVPPDAPPAPDDQR